MSYSLKSTGLATHVLNLIMVDDDDTTVVDIGSSPATLVVDANVTIENLDWNGVTRKAFETKSNGSFNFYGITFSANAPALPHGNGSGGNTQVAIYARATANGGLGYAFKASAGAIGMGLDSTGYDNPGAIINTSFLYGSSDSYTATDFSERVILAVTHEYGAVRQVFADTDGGTSTALDVDTTDAGFGANGTLDSIGGYAGQGHVRMRVLAYINFDSKLTLSEIQSLRDDWFGVLVDAPVVGGGLSIPVANQHMRNIGIR